MASICALFIKDHRQELIRSIQVRRLRLSEALYDKFTVEDERTLQEICKQPTPEIESEQFIDFILSKDADYQKWFVNAVFTTHPELECIKKWQPGSHSLKLSMQCSDTDETTPKTQPTSDESESTDKTLVEPFLDHQLFEK